jgi:xylan 1,4-beta-xylosidase
MGSPDRPSAAQYAALEKAGQLQALNPPQRLRVESGRLALTFSLPRQGVSLIRIQY